jgi:hypothetical protein
MLEFDSKGLLIPKGNISCSIDTLREVFVDRINSTTRLDLFNKYIGYSNALKEVLGVAELKQWINGSFVTKAANPRDIDLVTFVDYAIIEANELGIEQFNTESKKDGMLDVYIIPVYPKEHQQAFYYESDMAEWMDRFSKTRRDRNGLKNRKGFLEIIH